MLDQVFQFIQEYTGLVSPGITAMFLLGIFWKKTTARSAWIAVLITLPVPLALKWLYPEMPFLDNMAFSFLVIATQMVLTTLLDKRKHAHHATWSLPPGIFKNHDRVFIGLSLGLAIILVALYSVFW